MAGAGAPLRALGDVGMDTMAVQLPAGIAELHMDQPEPVPDLADSMLVGELPPAAVDTLLEAVGPGSASQLVSVELRHCGRRARAARTGLRCARQPSGFFPGVRGRVRASAGSHDAIEETPDSPGLILLGPGSAVEAITPAAEPWSPS